MHYVGFRIELRKVRHTIKNPRFILNSSVERCKDKLFEKNPGIYLKLCKKNLSGLKWQYQLVVVESKKVISYIC